VARGLDACPFCREHFPRGERARCPTCGVALVRAEKLPPSSLHDDEDEASALVSPLDERLPFAFAARNRGALALVALCGLVAFFLPWIHAYTPERLVFTGADVARRTGFSWAALVAWFTLLPLVLSRRTIRQMRGARLAVSMLGFAAAIAAGTLLANPPHSAEARGILVRLRFDWGYGLFVTLGLGLVAGLLGLRFGGRPDDIAVKTGTSAGQTVH
jgi:hypothetical protein